MILLCGIPSEPSLGLVIEAVRESGFPFAVFHQREFAATRIQFSLDSAGVRGWIELGGQIHQLEDFIAVYTRLMDHRLLPEYEGEPADSPLRFHCSSVHDALMRWYEIAPCLVLNRSGEVGVNYSKPYQAQLIREHGFAVPDTLVTNDPEAVLEFRRRHGKIIYKSASYIRSIVRTLDDADLDRLDAIRACPTQFQQYIDGRNIRVHTIGDKAIATSITAAATDYRYAYLEGEQERLEPITLSQELERRCVALSRALLLGFAGVDLKMTDSGTIYCLEVNPCPAFSYYQRHTGQPIAAAVAEYLARGA